MPKYLPFDYPPGPYLRMWDWEYPADNPNDRIKMSQEYLDYTDDVLILSFPIEFIARQTLDKISSPNFFNLADRLANKIKLMYGENAMHKFQRIIYDGMN